MSKTNIRIIKKCEFCGAEFVAQKVTTRFCSKKCSEHSYKKRMRQRFAQDATSHEETTARKEIIESVSSLEFLTPNQAATLLGLGKVTVYRYMWTGVIKARQFKGKTLIRRKDIEKIFDEAPEYVTRHKSEESTGITEWYTTKEVMEKFNVSNAWVFKVGKEQNIPKVLKFAKTYWSKKHFDAYFAKKAASPEITSWYTAEEIKEKFSMTDSAVWNFASKNAIPKKKEGGKTFYSKKHVDMAKGLPVEDEREYYTYKEAMAKYGLTHDQVCHYLKTYKIYKIKVGKITKFDRQQFDDLMAPPMV